MTIYPVNMWNIFKIPAKLKVRLATPCLKQVHQLEYTYLCYYANKGALSLMLASRLVTGSIEACRDCKFLLISFGASICIQACTPTLDRLFADTFRSSAGKVRILANSKSVNNLFPSF